MDDIDQALRLADDYEAKAVLRVLRDELLTRSPPRLTVVKVAPPDDRLTLTVILTHEDGSTMEVGHGDEYTWIIGGPVAFHGALEPSELSDVVVAALRGELTYVRSVRLGFKVEDHFEIVGHQHQRIGSGTYGLAGLPGRLLGKVPFPRLAVSRTGIGFDRTPAFSERSPTG